MFNILKSLLFRLKKSKMFWIMLAVVAFLPLLSLLLYKLVLQLADVLVDMPLDLELEMVTYISMTEWVLPSSTVNFLTLLCTSIFLCKEFSDGTIRNTLLSNKSRSSLYFAYALLSVIVGVSFLAANFVSTLLSLGIPFGFGDVTPNQAITSCATSFLMGVLSLLFVISCVLMFLFATGRQAPSIILPILITLFLPGIMTSLVELVSSLVMLIQVGNPDVAVEIDYTWVPLYNATMYDASNVDGALVGKISLYYVAFSALFVFLGRLAAVKKDLK